MIVEHDALAPERQRRAGKRAVGELQPIHLVALRVGDHRKLQLRRAGVVGAIVGSDRRDELSLREQRRAPRLAGLEASPQAQRCGIGVVEERVLIHYLGAHARIDDWFSGAQRRAQ